MNIRKMERSLKLTIQSLLQVVLFKGNQINWAALTKEAFANILFHQETFPTI